MASSATPGAARPFRKHLLLLVLAAVLAVTTLLLLHHKGPAAEAPTPASFPEDSTRESAQAGPVQTPPAASRNLEGPAREATTVAVAYVPPEVMYVHLHVLDAASREELDELTICRSSPEVSATTPLPSKHVLQDCLGERIVSPLVLVHARTPHAPVDPAVFFACNRGHAWRRVELDPLAGGELFLFLEPGGAVNLTLPGAARDRKLELVLTRTDVAPPQTLGRWMLRDLAGGPTPSLELEGLPVGQYQARVEIETNIVPEQVLTSKVFAIRAGDRAQVGILLGEKLERAPQTHLAVVLEQGWELERFHIEGRALDSGTAGPREFTVQSSEMTHREGSGVYSSKQSIEPGKFRLTIPEVLYSCEESIGERRTQALVVRAPTPVAVDVRDEKTGAVLTEAKLEWLETESDPPELTAIGHPIPMTAPGRFEFRAPIGPLALRASNPVNRSYGARTRSLSIESEMEPVEFRLAREYTVILTLLDGDRSVPWSRTKTLLTQLDSSEPAAAAVLSGFQWQSGRLRFQLAEPGNYRLEPIQVPGFHETPSCEVAFEASGNRTYAIQLPLIRE